MSSAVKDQRRNSIIFLVFFQELKNEAASSKRRPIDKDKLAKVNKEISQYKRQISELRSNTQKELDALKSKVFPRSVLVVVYFLKNQHSF